MDSWYSRAGTQLVAGVDEAGRGPLAGPVVAAIVLFPASWWAVGVPEDLAGLNDSKKLSAARRTAAWEASSPVSAPIASTAASPQIMVKRWAW